MPITRRDLSLMLPALAAGSAYAQEKPSKKVLTAASYKYEDLTVKQNGLNQSRAVFDGLTHTNFPVELHMTRLAPGQMPHAPHHHVNEEVMMLKNGELEIMQGGVTSRVTAGSIVYVQSNVEHGWKNIGTEPAEYFVIALGPKT